MNGIMEGIKNLVAFIIFSTVVKNLVGKSSYEKYVNFFMGIVLIIILIGPISKLFSNEGSMDYFLNQNNFKMEQAKIESELDSAKEKQEQAVMEDYERQLLEQVKGIVEGQGYYYYDGKIEIKMDENEYGIIGKMQLWVSLEERKKIEIQKIKLKEDNLEEGESEKIRKELKKTFMIEGEQIEIYLV